MDKTCSIPGCVKKAIARGWCRMHWRRWRTNGDPLVTKSRWDGHERKLNTCAVPGCENQQYKRLICKMHAQRKLRHGDFDTVKPHKRLYEFNEAILDTWTPQSAYLLGWVITDGGIYSRTHGADNYTLSFDLKDQEAVETLAGILEHPSGASLTSRGYWTLRAHSAHLVRRLQELGVGPAKSLSTTLPDVPGEVFSHLVRGIVEGDGSLTLHERRFMVAINSASSEFLPKLSEALPFRGSLFQVGKGKRKNPMWRLAYSGKEALRMCEWMYQDSDGMRLSRKYDRYLLALEGRS